MRKQDPEAWIRVVEWISPFILRWCRLARLQDADSQDVSQRVLQKLWVSFGGFRKENPSDTFHGWVYTITRNCYRDFLKKRSEDGKPLPSEVELPESPTPDDAPDLQQRAIFLILQEIVAKNQGDKGFQAFYRTAVDGLSAVDVAEELEMKPWVVRQHKCRWIKKLRDRLGSDFKDLLG